jgi:DNA (cytosine-5)-methyltransferase 1
MGRQDAETETLIPTRGGGFDVAHAIQAGALRQNPTSGPDGVGVQAGIAYTLEARSEVQAVCFSSKDYGADALQDCSPTLRAGGHAESHANAGVPPAVMQAGMSVRRLTPRECERLQGFPDDYTLIPYRNRVAADGPRYKAIGNSMAVPVMRWIGQRINEVDKW